MAAAEVLAWSPPASRFAGSTRLPRSPWVCRWEPRCPALRQGASGG